MNSEEFELLASVVAALHEIKDAIDRNTDAVRALVRAADDVGTEISRLPA